MENNYRIIEQYQTFVRDSAYHGRSGEEALAYYAMGLAGETGEVVEPIKKAYRDPSRVFSVEDLELELGDVLWYVTAIANHFNLKLDDIMQKNIDKLIERHQ